MMRARLEVALFLALASVPGLGWLLAPLVAASERPTAPDRAGERAPLSRRLSAAAVDLLLAWLVCLVPYLGWIVAALFLALRDHPALGGRSPGKRLAGLEVAGAGGVRDHARRNLTVALPFAQVFLVPVEVALLVSGRERLGDRWAGTSVVVAGPR